MAYVKHEWECGDILTPELMNHIEDGIEEASAASSPVSSKVRTVAKTTNVTVQASERRPFEVSFSELQGKTFLGILGVLPNNLDVNVVTFNGDYDAEDESFIVMVQLYNPTSATITTSVDVTVTYLDE